MFSGNNVQVLLCVSLVLTFNGDLWQCFEGLEGVRRLGGRWFVSGFALSPLTHLPSLLGVVVVGILSTWYHCARWCDKTLDTCPYCARWCDDEPLFTCSHYTVVKMQANCLNNTCFTFSQPLHRDIVSLCINWLPLQSGNCKSYIIHAKFHCRNVIMYIKLGGKKKAKIWEPDTW